MLRKPHSVSAAHVNIWHATKLTGASIKSQFAVLLLTGSEGEIVGEEDSPSLGYSGISLKHATILRVASCWEIDSVDALAGA